MRQESERERDNERLPTATLFPPSKMPFWLLLRFFFFQHQAVGLFTTLEVQLRSVFAGPFLGTLPLLKSFFRCAYYCHVFFFLCLPLSSSFHANDT